ncbi:beta-galactosidase [Paenibacillus sp. EC2-1]|uniref:beta-galactosidase n=1 Tax=Paenibacillus sp. EC2-1 TaxID=3388665 RepID=UPI003BEEEB27
MLYGACYYPEHREQDRWEEDLQLMNSAKINALRIGEFAWKRFEPEDGGYDFSWMDSFIELAGSYGIQIVLCPPMRTIPVWLSENDPSLHIENHNGDRLEHASRYTFCINHPLLRVKAHALASSMAIRYGSHPQVIGWHLDNEIGDEPDCHCHRCRSKWQQWLEGRYGDIQALNRAWGTVFWSMEYDHFGQIPTPRITKADYNPGFIQAWRHFRSDCNIEVVKLLATAIRPHLGTEGSYITTNSQMPWNNRTDNYEMAEHLDITGTNYYPPYGDRCHANALGLAANRSFKNAPFHVYELRNEGHSIMGASGNTPAPGELERLTMHTIANGADGVFYFPWKRFPFGSEQNHGAITDFDGKPTRIYNECLAIGEKLNEVASFIQGSHVISEIAVLYDFPSRWHVEHPSPWTGDSSLYMNHSNKLYHTVRKLGHNCDAVGRNSDFSAYKLILVPMLPIVDDLLVKKLQRYTDEGGVLVFHPMSGVKNEETRYFNDRLHPGMIDLMGIRTLEVATAGVGHAIDFSWNGQSYSGGLFIELIQPTTVQIEGSFAGEWYEGYPAVTKRSSGEGYCWFVATFAEENFYIELLTHLCSDIGLSPLLNIRPPAEVEITMRQHIDGTKYTFLINASAREKYVELNSSLQDIWNNEVVSGTVSLQPYQVRILRSAE